MLQPPNTERAKALIDDFATQMLDLTNGRSIPREWKNYLLKALRPPKKPLGRKPNLVRTKRLAAALVADRERLLREDRTNDDQRKIKLGKIAVAESTSVRTIERVRELVKKYLNALDLADEEKRKAISDGVGAAIMNEIHNELEAEFAREQKEHLQRIRSKFNATE